MPGVVMASNSGIQTTGERMNLEQKKAALRVAGAQVCEECGVVSWQPWAMIGNGESEICQRCFAQMMAECRKLEVRG